MCRLVCVRGESPFEIGPHLAALAHIAEHSREYQGHGWGCAWLEGGRWRVYRDIAPVWEDPRAGFGRTRVLVAHARSAFRDEGIRVENNMPFLDDEHAFAFNGELRGVRIKMPGRIGAEKVFNFFKRLDRGDPLDALRRAVAAIERRTRYVRAMNVVLAGRERCYVASRFNEDPGYFEMHERRAYGLHIVCSQVYPGESPSDWSPIPNGTVAAF